MATKKVNPHRIMVNLSEEEFNAIKKEASFQSRSLSNMLLYAFKFYQFNSELDTTKKALDKD
jgi:hypothetical protein